MDKATKQRIEALHPTVRCEVTNIIAECDRALTGRAKVRITQGLRTFAEQDGMYAQGRTKPGKIITKAKGGQSIHNYGFAVDICMVIDGKEVSWDTAKDWDGDKISDWMEVVAIFKKFGWDWGGDWKSFKDMPHFEKDGLTWQVLAGQKKDRLGYVILMLIVLLTVFVSCGSRKSSISKTAEKIETKAETKLEEKAESGAETKNDITETSGKKTQNDIHGTETNAKPINPVLPMKKIEKTEGNVKTTVWENAEVSEKTITDRSSAEEILEKKDLSEKNESQKSEKKGVIKNSASVSIDAEEKHTDAKRSILPWWLLLLVPVLVGIYYRKRIKEWLI